MQCHTATKLHGQAHGEGSTVKNIKPSLPHPLSSQISERLPVPGVQRPRQSQLTVPSRDAVKEF